MPNSVVIGPVMQSILSTGYVLYGVNQAGDIQQYQNQPNQWVTVGGPSKQFATNETDLFRVVDDGNVAQFQGTPNDWLPIGNNMSSLVAGGNMLLGISADSDKVMKYEGEPMGWSEIGEPVFSPVTNGRFIFGVSQSQQVVQYVETPPSWVAVGDADRQLYITGNALYAIDANGQDLLRYNGQPMSWLKIGQGWSQFADIGLNLFAISQDQSVVGKFTGTPGSWEPFAGPATGIAANQKFIFLNTAEGVTQNDPGDTRPEGKHSRRASDSFGQSADWVPWIWSFETADEAFAGYDGEVNVQLFQSNGQLQQGLTLPRTHFVRGKTYFLKMDVSPAFNNLEGISIGGQENFFDDQWHLGKVTAFDPTDYKYYTFDFNKNVPNNGTIYRTPSSVATIRHAPGVATVFVWNFLGKDVAWGHASIELDDGTYISWWPSGRDRKSMPLLPDVYCAPANDPQTYTDDVRLENGHDPDWRIPVGGLDNNKIRTWWSSFKTGHDWCTLSQNCSTTVADAMWAGGAASILTSRETDNFETIAVWTPDDALAFAQAIDTHLS